MGGQGIHGVAVPVQMDAPGDRRRDRGQQGGAQNRPQLQEAAQRVRAPERRPYRRSDQREKGQGMPHGLLVPLRLGHGDAGIGGEGDNAGG